MYKTLINQSDCEKCDKFINDLLVRGVAEVIVKSELEKELNSEKKLRIKFGIDPTGFDLTLGHAVVLKKLADFQKMGHQICFLFGNFTAKIGDPTGKDKTRKVLTDDEINKNSEKYLEQAGKILDIEKCEIFRNHDWLSKMTFDEILEVAGNFTVSQMMERDMFQQRVKDKREINLVEFFYPLMQGYDSVPMKADLELGGNDQLFNMLAARPIQKHFKVKPQNVLAMKILVGTDGKEKMSKSLGNYIALLDSPAEMFGKTMSLPDETMLDYFECLTDIDLEEANKMVKDNPRDAKVFLAKTIIMWLHDEQAAEAAEQDFIQKFVKKENPDEMPSFKIDGEIGILDLISKVCKFSPSNSEARRIIKSGGVTFGGEKVTDPNLVVGKGGVLKVGKRKFGEIVF